MSGKLATISVDDLEAAIEHIAYEWQMLWQTAFLLENYDRTERRAMLDKGAYSATVEAFAVHVRNLYEFFCLDYDEPHKHRFTRAFHYFLTEPHHWLSALTETATASLKTKLVAYNKMASQQVTHITYERNWLRPDQRHWHVWQAVKDMDEMAARFREVARTAKADHALKLADAFDAAEYRARRFAPLNPSIGPAVTAPSRLPKTPTIASTTGTGTGYGGTVGLQAKTAPEEPS